MGTADFRIFRTTDLPSTEKREKWLFCDFIFTYPNFSIKLRMPTRRCRAVGGNPRINAQKGHLHGNLLNVQAVIEALIG